MSDEQIVVGCYVTIGRNPLTWEVLELHEHASESGWRIAGHLKSGQSGRRRAEWLDNLRFHSAARK